MDDSDESSQTILSLSPHLSPSLDDRLDLSHQGLKHLSLKKMSMKGRILNFSHNILTQFPTDLPDDLEMIVGDHNCLSRLTDNQPEALRWLDVSHNFLIYTPKCWPQFLTTLIISHNHLTRLDYLPDMLESLDVSHNRLTQLPDPLPQTLQRLRVDDNLLVRLPREFPIDLHIIKCYHNAIPPAEWKRYPKWVEGLDYPRKEMVKRLPIRADLLPYNRPCPICLDSQSDLVLSCRHSYCFNCFFDWFRDHPNCPVCRQEVRIKDIYQLAHLGYQQGGYKQGGDKQGGDKLPTVVAPP